MRAGVLTGLLLATLWLGIGIPQDGYSAGPGAVQGPRATVAMKEGLVAYRTGEARRLDFVKLLARSTGLEIQGIELLDEARLPTAEGREPLPVLMAWLLEGYNYVLLYDNAEGAGSPTGALVIAGRKGPPMAGVPETSPAEVGEGRTRTAAVSTPPAAISVGQRIQRAAASDGPDAPKGTAPAPISAMLGHQLSPFRTSALGEGSLASPESAATAGNADSPAADPGDDANYPDLQESTQRALAQVQELARALGPR